jgi:hypothetical protein
MVRWVYAVIWLSTFFDDLEHEHLPSPHLLYRYPYLYKTSFFLSRIEKEDQPRQDFAVTLTHSKLTHWYPVSHPKETPQYCLDLSLIPVRVFSHLTFYFCFDDLEQTWTDWLWPPIHPVILSWRTWLYLAYLYQPTRQQQRIMKVSIGNPRFRNTIGSYLNNIL